MHTKGLLLAIVLLLGLCLGGLFITIQALSDPKPIYVSLRNESSSTVLVELVKDGRFGRQKGTIELEGGMTWDQDEPHRNGTEIHYKMTVVPKDPKSKLPKQVVEWDSNVTSGDYVYTADGELRAK